MGRKTAEETATAAAELYAAKDEADNEEGFVDLAPARHLSTVVSVRLSEHDVDVIERAAAEAGIKLSSFLRQAALAAATDRGRVSREEVTRTVTRVHSQILATLEELRASVDRASA
jgi:uncharacterized protein (DUF1778 family)